MADVHPEIRQGSVTETLTGIPTAATDICGNEYSDDADPLAFMIDYGGRPTFAPVGITVTFSSPDHDGAINNAN